MDIDKNPQQNTSKLNPVILKGLDIRMKENDRPIFLVNIDITIFNKILVNWIQQQIKKIIHQYQVAFISWMQGWFNTWKSITVIYHIIRMGGGGNMVISSDTEISFDKIWHPLMIKTLNKLGSRNHLKIIKTIYKNPQLTTYSVVKMENFSPRMKNKTRMQCPLLSCFLSV